MTSFGVLHIDYIVCVEGGVKLFQEPQPSMGGGQRGSFTTFKDDISDNKIILWKQIKNELDAYTMPLFGKM